MTAGFDTYCDYLQRMDGTNVGELTDHVSPGVHFKDPFNDVHGAGAMRAVFIDMFEHLHDPDFTIHHRMNDGDICVIVWTLSGRLMNRDWSVDGASQLRFDQQGMLSEHIDHWDAASGLYEKIPAVGWFIRYLRKRLEVAR
ncbi:nuclear transport factor 2 family protein [Thalassospiraceae bacterium LMO-JJ14]|nr:nuclear transport factor 2 family protein [Thalassospiraceae bacterium LMO-JJ14]